jgi:hypothetical protein
MNNITKIIFFVIFFENHFYKYGGQIRGIYNEKKEQAEKKFFDDLIFFLYISSYLFKIF